jgi:hypothetical protein
VEGGTSKGLGGLKPAAPLACRTRRFLCYNVGMLEQLTIDSFQPHVGSTFWVEFPNDTKVELRLTGTAKVMESEAARLARHPFSVFFVGPRSFMLQQHTYRVTHEQLGTMEIFLVPVAQNADSYEYEAVFT